MLKKVKRLLKSLRRESGGNVMLIFALGMPVFVGGAGLAVDTAQWYMWKREMQYAVDQAALAGAWSRVGGSEGNVYKTRAQQELAANLQVVDFQGTPTINLANFAGGTNNSVQVTLSATRSLPFSAMLMGEGTTIAVRAQASFEKGRTFTACLIAVDPDTSGAITIGGSAYIVANCGAAALSNNAEAVIRNGNPVFDVGYIVAGGGIDNDFDNEEDLEIYENQTGLVDPFKDLTPPDNPTARTYVCESATTYTAYYTLQTTVVDKLYTAPSSTGPWTLSTTTNVSSASERGSEAVDETVHRGDTLPTPEPVTATGTVQTVPGSPTTICTGNGRNRVCTTTTSATSYSRTDRVTSSVKTVDRVGSTSSYESAAQEPGTYSDFTMSCDTTMAKGVYVIDGGLFKINASYSLVGRGVMIVLKNGAGIEINGNATLDLRAMTSEEMIEAGISQEQALKLKDMLIFEDRDSEGYSGNSVNGTAGGILEGTVYLPKSPIKFNGTFGVVERCLVITAKTITIEGNANMTSFCPTGVTNSVSIGGGVTSVKLVA